MKWTRISSKAAYVLIAAALSGCAGMGGGGPIFLRATGAEEVPPVTTSASGTGQLTVNDDRTVSGSFKTQGSTFGAAHIHEGAAGQNGPVIIPLTKSGDSDWVVPPGAKLTDAQYNAFKAGGLYVNFHSAQHKGGEIRAQIRPSAGGSGSSGGSSY
jgi:hypothetical protein